ncbi:tRNA preQ1(34) S-adenosylmethionine ribosyltransferase-isomerase QueA [Anaerotardibacter muris]|uniref:tRNA preQ1(34) S-adenosylmethionine ribosyltransferase-isomerase QueA n=1 Tax=Anaerotardibacter muris TaxID=2941505 RepID=UPI00203BA5F7|nr:tRNA preQ1(34) S-adenosylmethionine ribosyltransferase-isomerase QueA [Anaerotardibacter muris]
MTTSDFDYDLPPELIAQTPHPDRDGCKMLVMKRENGSLQDRIFRDIYDYLKPGDLLVANETRVIPARLLGSKHETGGAAEVLLLRERFDVEPKTDASAVWEALVKPGRRLKPGAVVDFFASDADTDAKADAESEGKGKDTTPLMQAEILDWVEDAQKGERLVRLTTPLSSLDDALHQVGHTPLPPYIKNYQGDEELYQTVFSREEKSAAAPTAGLHFTPELIARLKEKGVGFETVHLEVGLDTFRVVDVEDPHEHQMHTEYYSVPQKTVDAILETKKHGGRVIAVGTTSVRSLESAWDKESNQLLARDRQTTDLFIFPGYEFKVVDALITNFHVPRSTLMMLVSAFSSRDNVMKAYRHAIKRKYRLLSFGDAMFLY